MLAQECLRLSKKVKGREVLKGQPHAISNQTLHGCSHRNASGFQDKSRGTRDSKGSIATAVAVAASAAAAAVAAANPTSGAAAAEVCPSAAADAAAMSMRALGLDNG